MLVAYLTSLVIGGSLLLLTVVGGGDSDVDADIDADGDLDFGGMDAWLPYSSLRFWTFFSAFFGLVGTALWAVTDMGLLSLVPSIVVGYVCGVAATRILRSLTGTNVGKVRSDGDLVGVTGDLLLPADKESPGKIRMHIGGRTIEELAYCDEGLLEAGQVVLVLSPREGGGVWVTSARQLEEQVS